MRSANEISALVLKAARGAGMSLGCAEELARAAPLLVTQDAFDQVLEMLCLPFDAPTFKDGVISGGHPVQAVIAWRELSAAKQDVVLTCSVSDVVLNAICTEAVPCGPFDVDAEIWSALIDFAARMLVPDSQASRLAGAGAGLSDND